MADTPARPTVRMRDMLTIWILFFINLFNYIDRYIVAGVLEKLIYDKNSGFGFDLSDYQAGLLTTAFIVAYMILSPIFGFLGDRYKRSTLIAVGLVLWAASTFCCSIVSKYWQLLLFRATVGVGEASYAALAPTIIADLIPPKLRTFYLSFFFVGTPVGGALGYIIGGGIAAKCGWRWAFRVSPPFCLLLAVLTVFLVQNPERGGSDLLDNDSIQTRSQEIRSPQNPILQLGYESWTLCKTKSFVSASIGFACLSFVIGALTQWIPVYVQRASLIAGTPYTNESANFVFGVLTCIAGLVAIPCGSLLSNFLEPYTGKRDALINAFGLLIASVTLYIAIAAAPVNMMVFWVFCFITQLAVFVGWAPNTAIILYTCPSTMRSLASSINILFAHLFGDALSPTIQGKLSDRIKVMFGNFDISISDCVALEYSFFLSCFVCLLGSVFYFWCAETVINDRINAADTIVSRRPTMVRSRANSFIDTSAIMRDEYEGPLTRPLLRRDQPAILPIKPNVSER